MPLRFPLDLWFLLWYHSPMGDHRIRLTDSDIMLIIVALSARLAMLSGKRRHQAERLIERLSDSAPGNPRWRLDDESQRQEQTIHLLRRALGE